MKSVLITGFEKFGDYDVNATEVLAELTAKQRIARHRIDARIFETEIFQNLDPGVMLLLMADKLKARAVISFGMSSEAKGIRLERIAVNWVMSKYCLPEENKRLLYEQIPHWARYKIDFSPWNIKKMQAGFERKGIPYEKKISEDAGQYICNALIFRILHNMSISRHKFPFLFVHVPCSPEAVKSIKDFDPEKILMKEDELVEALGIIISCLN